MDIEKHELGPGVVVVRCAGRLNMVAAPGLKACLDLTLEGGGRNVVLDLEGVPFIDSSGLGVLIGGLKKARQVGGDLRIVAVSEQVSTVLGLTNLDRVLRPYDSVEAATRGW